MKRLLSRRRIVALGVTVATRNFDDFVDFGVAVYNPFSGEMNG